MALSTSSVTLPHWDGVSKPVTYMGPALVPPGENMNFKVVDIPVAIRDGRAQHDLRLDTAGFELVEAATRLPRDAFFVKDRNARDRSVVEQYYPECINLVKATTGAAKVIAFDHNVRQASVNLFADRGKDDATSSGTTVDGAVKFVHNDYTDKSGPQRVRDFSIAGGSYTVNGALLSEVEAEQVLRGRYAFINVWRALNVADDVPLAVCDARSMSEDDFVGNTLVYPERVGETHVIAHRAEHQWSFFPRMHRGEALLLKCWDSHRVAGKARFTAHTAFQNPAAAPGVPPRESIEVRCLAIFDADASEIGVSAVQGSKL